MAIASAIVIALALRPLAPSIALGQAEQNGPGGPMAGLDLSAEQLRKIIPLYNNFAYALRDALWHSTDIPVCWEDPPKELADARELVRSGIGDTWERVSNINFTGWGACKNGAHGLRISVVDTGPENGPHVLALGRQLDGVPNGVTLNLTFASFNSGFCRERLDYCIRVLAVHEFGHALGFSHENNRDDRPETCRAERQGADGDWEVGRYDPASVMNYCNANYLGDGHLSALDIKAVQLIYGEQQG